MANCLKCGKEFRLGSTGWMSRLEGPAAGILPESRLKKILICPDDFGKLGPVQKGSWHEHIDPPKGGPTREKRIGRLGDAQVPDEE
jgi:hypothetical protein